MQSACHAKYNANLQMYVDTHNFICLFPPDAPISGCPLLALSSLRFLDSQSPVSALAGTRYKYLATLTLTTSHTPASTLSRGFSQKCTEPSTHYGKSLFKLLLLPNRLCNQMIHLEMMMMTEP